MFEGLHADVPTANAGALVVATAVGWTGTGVAVRARAVTINGDATEPAVVAGTGVASVAAMPALGDGVLGDGVLGVKVDEASGPELAEGTTAVGVLQLARNAMTTRRVRRVSTRHRSSPASGTRGRGGTHREKAPFRSP